MQAIAARIVEELDGKTGRLTGVRRAGIDELACRKGQRYIMIAVGHDTGRLIWAAQGRNQDTVRKFFDALGDERSKQLAAVTADGVHAGARSFPHHLTVIFPVPPRTESGKGLSKTGRPRHGSATHRQCRLRRSCARRSRG